MAKSRAVRLAVGAIVKDEYPYLLEWISYHQLQGVSKFYIAENDSADRTPELLTALHRLGVVEYIPFKTIEGAPAQLRAYSHILEQFNRDFDWIAFIDADEFIRPATSGANFSEFLGMLDTGTVGAVALNWAIYGSSGLEEFDPELTIARFTLRAEEKYVQNHHYKSVVSSGASPAQPQNPHNFRLPRGLRLVHPDGSVVKKHPLHGNGLSRRIVWHDFRLNHYSVRSRAEFFEIKAPRGLADSERLRDNEKFFTDRDRNDVTDAAEDQVVHAVQEHVRDLVERLRDVGFQYGRPGLESAERIFDGEIDGFGKNAESFNLLGWGFHKKSLRPVTNFKVFVKGVEARCHLLRRGNSASLQTIVGNSENCGFDLAVNVNPNHLDVSDVELLMYDDEYAHFDSVVFDPVSITGFVDRIFDDGERLVVSGWYFLTHQSGADAEEILVRSGDVPIVEARLVRCQRKDVVAQFPHAPEDCGFRISVPKTELIHGPRALNVYVVVGKKLLPVRRTTRVVEEFSKV